MNLVLMLMDLLTLFCRHAAVSFGKQLHLSDLVGDGNWHFDLASGLLTFGDKYNWHTQLLGVEAPDGQTWFWGWANDASQIPTHLLGSALTLRMLGQHVGITELTDPELPLDLIDGHSLAMIGSGVCRAAAYYRCPYDWGAIYLLINDEGFPSNREPPLARLTTVFPQTISAIDVRDHRLALAGWLDYYGIAWVEDCNSIVVREGDETVLTASFADRNRLATLEVIVQDA